MIILVCKDRGFALEVGIVVGNLQRDEDEARNLDVDKILVSPATAYVPLVVVCLVNALHHFMQSLAGWISS
jgi:hypothetical protein